MIGYMFEFRRQSTFVLLYIFCLQIIMSLDGSYMIWTYRDGKLFIFLPPRLVSLFVEDNKTSNVSLSLSLSLSLSSPTSPNHGTRQNLSGDNTVLNKSKEHNARVCQLHCEKWRQ